MSSNLLEPRDLLRQVLCHMVDDPSAVRIEGHEAGHIAVFDVHVAYDDMGKVLGRGGANAEAIRHLFGAIYRKYGKRLHIQVVAPSRR